MAGPGFDFGTPDGYDFFLRMGPLGNADEKFFKGKIEYWRDIDFARHLFGLLEIARPAALFEEHQSRRDDGGRLV